MPTAMLRTRPATWALAYLTRTALPAQIGTRQVACSLHVFSKGSEVAFNEAFGKSKADTPGAQRLLFMVHYLVVHNKQSFYLFCKDKKNLNHNEIHIPALGERADGGICSKQLGILIVHSNSTLITSFSKRTTRMNPQFTRFYSSQ